MADLERAVQPLIGRTLTDEGPVTFSRDERQLIARWATIKAWCIELANRETYNYPEAHIPAGHFEWLMTHDEPPPGTGVSMMRFHAADTKDGTHTGYLATIKRHQLMRRGDTAPCGHLATFTLGFAGFQVLGTDLRVDDVGATTAESPEMPPETLWPFLIPIWPYEHPTVNWPPSDEVTFDMLDRVAVWDGVLGTPPPA